VSSDELASIERGGVIISGDARVLSEAPSFAPSISKHSSEKNAIARSLPWGI